MLYRYDLESGRPLAGYVTFCPGSIDINGNLTDMLEDAVHQVTSQPSMAARLAVSYYSVDAFAQRILLLRAVSVMVH